MKINIVEIDYKDWIKNPFPQIKPILIDESTKYVILNCPKEYSDYLKSIGIKNDK